MARILEMNSFNRNRLASRTAEVIHATLSLTSPSREQGFDFFYPIRETLFTQREDCKVDTGVIAELQPSLNLLLQYFIVGSCKNDSEVDSDMKAVVMALYGDLLPSYAPVKLGRESLLRASQTEVATIFASNITHGLSHSMVKTLQPSSTEVRVRFMVAPDDDKAWDEYFTFIALSIFAQTACISREPEKRILHGIVRFAAYRSISLQDECSIAVTAISLLLFYYKHLGQEKFVRSLLSFLGPEMLGRLFEKCLYWENPNGDVCLLYHVQVQLVSLLIQSITDLQNDIDDSLAHVVMGLTGWSLSRQTQALSKPFSKQSLNDFCPYPNVLDGIVHIISDSLGLLNVDIQDAIKVSTQNPMKVSQNQNYLAMRCLEFLYLFLSAKTPTVTTEAWSIRNICVLTKLRHIGFWEKTLAGLCESPLSNSLLLHQLSYTLQGIAIGLLYSNEFDLQGIFNKFVTAYCLVHDSQDVLNEGSIPSERQSSLAHFSKSSALLFRVLILIGCKRGLVGSRDILTLVQILLNLNSNSQLMLSHSSTVFWLIGQIIRLNQCDGPEMISLIYLILHEIGNYDSPDGKLDECIGILSCALSALIIHFLPILCTVSISETVINLQPSLRTLEKLSASSRSDNLRECTRSALFCLDYLIAEGKEETSA